MFEWIIEKEGFKVGIEDYKLLFLIDPNEIPVDPPGICFFKGSSPKDSNFSIGINIATFVLGQGTSLQDDVKKLYSTGDSLLLLDKTMECKFRRHNIDFFISLVPNEKGRAGKLQITCDDISIPAEELNNYFFRVANEVLNNISVQYCIPIGFIYFIMLHHDLEFFTFVEKFAVAKKFEGVFMEPKCDWDLWHLASGNYRKAWLSFNPVERFLDLYLAIEGVRAAIKKALSLNYKMNGPIKHSKYKEPILVKHFSINTNPAFPQLVGMSFYDILYKKRGLRSLRNVAAHAIQENSGDYVLNTKLGDYITFQDAIQYLNYIYIEYTNILIKLTQ